MKFHPPLAKAKIIPPTEQSFDPFVGLTQHQMSVLFPPGALAFLASERERKIRQTEEEKVQDDQKD